MNRKSFVTAAAVLVLAVGCEPNIEKSPPQGPTALARFDPEAGVIPLPNDLLLVQPVSSLGLPPAQAELVSHFQMQGGFPSDQEVPIVMSFTTRPGAGDSMPGAPQLDLSSFTNQTFFVAVLTPGQMGMAPLEPLTPADYTVTGDIGVLTVHHQGRTPWPPGEYGVFVRGGSDGIKTVSGEAVYPTAPFYLIAQGQDLTAPQNIGLLVAQAGSHAAAEQVATQLNGVIALFEKTGAFAACDLVFPHQELALGQTFRIAATGSTVEIDPARGKVPLPFDLLRNPGPKGTLTPLASCTFAGGTLDANGKCSAPGAGGFEALDGFSTTGAILAPTSTPVQVSTVTPSTMQLWDLTNPAQPVLVDPTTYITEPCELASSCAAGAVSPVIALQPSGATKGDPTSVFRTRPLKDATDYAVVISNGVLDAAGHPLSRGTIASVLLFQNPLVDANGTSQLQGVDGPTAASLEIMRKALVPVLAAAAQKGIATDAVVLAYTFRTQTILSTAAKLGALPYAAAPSKFNAVTSLTPDAAFARYGVASSVPHAAIAQVLEAKVVTLNLLDPATGAFFPDAAQAKPEPIDVLITIPVTPAKNAMGLTPLVVFRHGLGGGRADMLTVANTFAARGVILAAIDASKHGNRSLCTSGTTTTMLGGVTVPVCAGAVKCVTSLPPGAQGDAAPPGACPNGFVYRPVSASCSVPGACPGFDPTAAGIAVVSGNYLVSANFFRTRDTLRQDIIDESQLIRVLAAVPPNPPAATGDPVFDLLLGQGIVIDPSSVGYVGQSLGAIQGAANVAANPRISAAVLNVGGGTIVDIFTNSPAFAGQVNALLASQGIARGTPQYLQFLVVAKMVLDPADPLNFAGHLSASMLPNLLMPATPPQQPKRVLTQAAFCDQVVPNPFNALLDATAGTGPLPGMAGFGGPGTFQFFVAGTNPAVVVQGCTAATQPSWVSHGFFTDWSVPERVSRAQTDAAAFLIEKAEPLGLVLSP